MFRPNHPLDAGRPSPVPRAQLCPARWYPPAMDERDNIPVLVREARSSDAPCIARLFAEMAAEMGSVTAPTTSVEAARNLPDDPRFLVLLAEMVPPGTPRAAAASRRPPVGLCIVAVAPDLWTGRNSAEIRALVVTAGYRGRGVGRRLLTEAADRATALGCAYLYLLTEQRERIAHSLYRSCAMRSKEVLYFELAL